MALDVGSRLGPYSVTAKIGEGGMGEVYRARDTKLDREVALKVLPQAFTEDPDRLARFEREAKVLASLNHPGIAGIYGLEESGDTRALVLELVEGPTLADRIAKGPIPLDEALPIAKQIAEALEAAHEAGVIHRDLKPANIKVREDGTVKVLDFGLAKALDPTPESDPSQSPTLTAAATQMGVIMGTAAYMSPEQARGSSADHRSDVWSFGVVVFEMLTGNRLFAGETVSDTLASILKSDIVWSRLGSETPPACRRLLHRCLERDRNERLQHIGDARADINEALLPPSEDDRSSGLPATRWRQPIPWAVGVALALAVGFWVGSRQRSDTPGPVRLSITAPVGVQPASPVASPDGQTVVFHGDHGALVGGHVYSRSLSQVSAVPLEGASGAFPKAFSPDGQWLLVSQRDVWPNILKRLPVTGGPALPVTEITGWFGAAWGPDGTIVTGSPDGLMQIGVSGGEPARLTTVDEGEIAHVSPSLLPGRPTILFHVLTEQPDDSFVAAYDLNEQTQERLTLGTSPRFATSGHLVFWRQDSLWAVPFDPEGVRIQGEAIPIEPDVWAEATGEASYSISPQGILTYLKGKPASPRRSLVWVDRQGIETPVEADPDAYLGLDLSPDDTRVVVGSGYPNLDISILDLERRASRRLTVHPGIDWWPLWSPDGEWVVFGSDRNGPPNTYRTVADGRGAIERLTTSPNPDGPSSFSPDGTVLVTYEARPDTQADVVLVAMDGNAPPTVLIQNDAQEETPKVSPDGRWIAYASDESGQREVYVRPFPNVDEGRWQISTDGGGVPLWGPDSGELFYVTNPGDRELLAVMATTVETEPEFAHSRPRMLFEGAYLWSYQPFDISSDGERFLMIKNAQANDAPAHAQELIVVHNWHEELKRLVPTPWAQ